jgi:hypothetical protein
MPYASTKKAESGTDRRIRCDEFGNLVAVDNSIPILTGGQSEKIAISGTSAQSSAITTDKINIYADVDCFVRQGANPVALADGTDQIIPAGVMLRGYEITSGNKLAFIAASTSGNVYLTPGG